MTATSANRSAMASLIQIKKSCGISCLFNVNATLASERVPAINLEETSWAALLRAEAAACALIGLNRRERHASSLQTGKFGEYRGDRYLEQRYSALEHEIAHALLRSPADDLRVADLKYRKFTIADEIAQHRLAVQRSDPVD